MKTITAEEKKQAILNVIFKRASELEEKALEWLNLTNTPDTIDHQGVSDSALKKAFQEWKENKPVFDKPSFL